MQGLMRFPSLSEALRYGFEVCGRTKDGYLVRTRTERGWALAVVVIDNGESP
jgi:hypothetical protein